jgi:hypothetical protein
MVNSKHYTNNIFELFFQMLTEEEKLTKFLVKEKLEADYGQRKIRGRLRPPRSPDLGVCDFYECGTLSKKCTGTISTL